MTALRPYQTEAIEKLRQSLKAGRRRPVLQAATGAGKTLLSAAIIDSALNRRRRVIFTVPAISLVDQTVDAFLRAGVSEVGVMQGIHELTDHERPVQIASIQTLMRRPIPPADLWIVDEAHRQFDWLNTHLAKPEMANVPVIGLSATPWARGMAKHWDDLIVAATTRDLIGQGYLSPFRVFAPSHPDLAGVKVEKGDYATAPLSKVMQAPKLVADTVQTWLEKAEDRPTFCFAVDRAHAKHLQRRFEEAGVSTGYIDAYVEGDERAAIMARFRSGAIKVLCNVGCLTTGVDADCRCIVLARPTKSEMLYVQMIGRGLRTAPGKADCLVLDHSDTTLRLGFVDEIHHDALDDGKPKGPTEKRERLPRDCKQCGFVKPVGVAQCPCCGHLPVHGPRAVEVANGQLQEITVKRKASDQEKRQFFAELKGYARERGYKDGWASQKFKTRFGGWPGPVVKSAGAVKPTPATLNWIKAQQIAWAKAKEGRPDRPFKPEPTGECFVVWGDSWNDLENGTPWL